MSSVFDIAASGLRAQSRALEVSANNVVNVLSLGVHPDPALAKPEAYNQIQALRMFEANVKVIQTQDRMLGALLDIVS